MAETLSKIYEKGPSFNWTSMISNLTSQINTLIFFYKQLGLELSPRSCFYFPGFSGLKLFNGCLVVWPNNLRLRGYPDNCPPRLGLECESRSGLVLGFGVNQTIAPEKNSPPVRVRVWLRVSFGVVGQFSSGAIVQEPFFKRDNKFLMFFTDN